LAAVLKQERGIEPELIQGSGGIFDVKMEGRLIFSKKVAGRFPDEEEILELVPE
jgi:selenoprotein W-related protein